MFAAIDDTVRLPGYVRADAAVYYSLTERTRLQVNAENLFDRKYYVNADSNTNISPGAWFFADQPPATYDPEKARALLKEAGYS